MYIYKHGIQVRLSGRSELEHPLFLKTTINFYLWITVNRNFIELAIARYCIVSKFQVSWPVRVVLLVAAPFLDMGLKLATQA
jgi:hypothetical protein